MKNIKFYALVCLSCVALSSCATILGGPVTAHQKTKPAAGQPQRDVRVGALVADLILTGAIGTVIDFATGAIYKPAPKTTTTTTTTTTPVTN